MAIMGDHIIDTLMNRINAIPSLVDQEGIQLILQSINGFQERIKRANELKLNNQFLTKLQAMYLAGFTTAEELEREFRNILALRQVIDDGNPALQEAYAEISRDFNAAQRVLSRNIQQLTRLLRSVPVPRTTSLQRRRRSSNASANAS